MLKKSYGEDDMGKYMPELDIMPEPDIIGKSETDIMNRRNVLFNSGRSS